MEYLVIQVGAAQFLVLAVSGTVTNLATDGAVTLTADDGITTLLGV